MAGEFNAEFPFRNEGKTGSNDNSKKDPTTNNKYFMQPESAETSGYEMPDVTEESSPIGTYQQPNIQYNFPTPPPKTNVQIQKNPNQYVYMEYDYEEEHVEVDKWLFTAHPMHKCPNICEYIKDCMFVCERTMHVLMCRTDAYMHGRQIAMLQDCAEVCHLTTRQVARRSPMLKTALRYCAKVSRMCGQECMQHPDRESQACARMCLHCAKICESFVAQHNWA